MDDPAVKIVAGFSDKKDTQNKRTLNAFNVPAFTD
jgi:hypothetical protein